MLTEMTGLVGVSKHSNKIAIKKSSLFKEDFFCLKLLFFDELKNFNLLGEFIFTLSK
jgi:hypothetical protein